MRGIRYWISNYTICMLGPRKDFSLGLERGEIVTLLGHNGAGKSTTLQVIAGLRQPSSGTITFNGENIVRKDIVDDLSVEGNLKIAGYFC